MDKTTYKLRLEPVGTEITAPVGTPLKSLLFEHGVEFPCGGNGRCRGCKIRVVEGEAPVTESDRLHLSDDERASGWRLACQAKVTSDIKIELRQWDASILSNDSGFPFTPQEGLGVAVDLGTTTLVAQLLDLSTGKVLAVRTALNAQAEYGGDIMSRVQFAVADNGHQLLKSTIREQIGRLITQLIAVANLGHDADLRSVVIVGNTVMHHLFCDIDCAALSHYPFEPVSDGLQQLTAAEVGWTKLPPAAQISFLPCLGGFVGSDLLAGILATGIDKSDKLSCLIDLGTNGEIVIGNKDGLLCASTAAGPAFEGARIAMGMRASTGAVWKVVAANGGLKSEVLGDVPPRGICGSGLVDAVAASLEIGLIRPTGRISSGEHDLLIDEPVKLTQTDIRQLQLAKGAIAAGVRMLLMKLDATHADVENIYLAGAFGNYINRLSAQRIGLIDFPEERVAASGNTALLGAKIALCAGMSGFEYKSILANVEHVSLSADDNFQDIYVEEMGFADPDGDLEPALV